jgi:hypothetical protein
MFTKFFLAVTLSAVSLGGPRLLVADEPPAAGAAEAAKEAAKAAAEAAKEAAQAAIDEAKAAAAQASEQAQEAAKQAIEQARAAADQARHLAVHSDYQLGIHVAPVPKALDAQLDLAGEGVLVDRVTPDGPADKAGIKQHDLILKAGDQSIKSAADLLKAIAASEGKELEIKLLRAGKAMNAKVTPTSSLETRGKLGIVFPAEEVEVEVRKLEEKIREKLKDAGVDVRMQLVRPGQFVPRGAPLGFSWIAEKADLPEDLTITVRKHGKDPAEIEVKRGDQAWTVKENELDKLPEDVRKHVEPFLARGPARFTVTLPGGKPFNVPVPPVLFDESEVIERKHGVQTRARVRGALERRIDELSRDMDRMRDRMETLRGSLREELRRLDEEGGGENGDN